MTSSEQNMDDSDDVPPLEDMTGVLKANQTRVSQQVQRASVDQNQGSGSHKFEGAKNFGGLKKGFLTAKHKSNDDSGSATVRPPKCPPNNDNIPHLRRKSPNTNRLEIPEVQEAMKITAPLLASREWVTDDLLEKIESHPLLSKAFRDPSLSQVLAEFQRNPEAMLKAAQGNQEMMQFLQEFSSLMGGHFATLSGKIGQDDSKKAPEGKLITEACTSSGDCEESKFKELLRRPDIQQILLDKDVQRLIATLKSDPDQAQQILRSSNADFREKVHILVDNGILAIQQAPV